MDPDWLLPAADHRGRSQAAEQAPTGQGDKIPVPTGPASLLVTARASMSEGGGV